MAFHKIRLIIYHGWSPIAVASLTNTAATQATDLDPRFVFPLHYFFVSSFCLANKLWLSGIYCISIKPEIKLRNNGCYNSDSQRSMLTEAFCFNLQASSLFHNKLCIWGFRSLFNTKWIKCLLSAHYFQYDSYRSELLLYVVAYWYGKLHGE